MESQFGNSFALELAVCIGKRAINTCCVYWRNKVAHLNIYGSASTSVSNEPGRDNKISIKTFTKLHKFTNYYDQLRHFRLFIGIAEIKATRSSVAESVA